MMNLDLDDYYIGREKIITVVVVAAPTGALLYTFFSFSSSIQKIDAFFAHANCCAPAESQITKFLDIVCTVLA